MPRRRTAWASTTFFSFGKDIVAVTRTLGVALSCVSPPARGAPLFDLAEDEMEVGIGIHGEPGRRREPLTSADSIVATMLDAVVSDLPFVSGDRVALMINGLGGTPLSELYLLFGSAHHELATRASPSVAATWASTAILEMAGASLTLVRLDSLGPLSAGAGGNPISDLLSMARWLSSDYVILSLGKATPHLAGPALKRRDRDRVHLL